MTSTLLKNKFTSALWSDQNQSQYGNETETNTYHTGLAKEDENIETAVLRLHSKNEEIIT